MDRTLDYYERNTERFIEDTRNTDFSHIQNEFAALLPENAHILDLGCGAGRDSKAFMDHSYAVTPADGSPGICENTAKFLGIPVRNMRFDELDDVDVYDGVWACASLLHVKRDELNNIFQRIARSLKTDGVFYCSFKKGEFCGYRSGRYFTDLTEQELADLLADNFVPIKIWETVDVRPGRSDQKWVNAIARKRQAPHG